MQCSRGLLGKGNEENKVVDLCCDHMGSAATTENEGLLGADFVSHNLALHQNGDSQLPPPSMAKYIMKYIFKVVPCAVLSLFIHPKLSKRDYSINSILWAVCIYLESVSVLPQLRLMQNAKIVEPFAAHYVFVLGIERFLSCAIWILQVINSHGRLLTALSY
ncbi:hypothetical protein TanjilG_14686 [Lupinus angustifolius]|uniref:ER lumen protein-retaining receptor n=1 Tax=Lupinus angustifolius TaxID=3871 RepID=A0A1J7HP04_LUPAN|nr:hypothetical protein TanjilG_14686 [Lupinus angustifolius]